MVACQRQPVMIPLLAIRAACAARRLASSISVRAIVSARRRPPSKTPPRRSSMSFAAVRGLSPTATPRMRACFMTAACSRGSRRDAASICFVVRFTIASSALASILVQSNTAPEGSSDATSRCCHAAIASAIAGMSLVTVTPIWRARSSNACRVAANAFRARSARITCALVGHSSPVSRSAIAACHSSASSSHADDQARASSRVCASMVASNSSRSVCASHRVSSVTLTPPRLGR